MTRKHSEYEQRQNLQTKLLDKYWKIHNAKQTLLYYLELSSHRFETIGTCLVCSQESYNALYSFT